MSKQGPDNRQEQEQQKQAIRRLVMILLALTIIGISGRLFLFKPSQLAGGDRLWRLTINALVKTTAQATAVQIYPPIETQRIRVVQRTLRHPGFHIRNWSEEQEQRRSILAFATTDGKQSIHSEFILHLSKTPQIQVPIAKTLLTNQEREKYLFDGDLLQLKNPILTGVLQKLSQGQTDKGQLLEAIFHYLQTFTISYGRSDMHVPTTLANKKATALDRSLAMVALCRAGGIPARVVSGILLQEDIEPRLHYWAGVYLDEKWQSFDIQSGYRHQVPANYLPLRRDGTDIVQVLNGELLQLDFDLEREFNHPYLRQLKDHSPINIFDLTRLPLDARNELALLLLLPFGILVTALCRHLVGLHSYGVFTPTLLALALVYTDRVMTLVIFLVVCALAVAGRSLFPATITRIPRLAIIFTLVAMILSLSVSVLDYFNLNQTGKMTLLPIIILTSLIDRLYRTIEDKGLTIAMHRLIWTVLIALLCLPVIQFESLGHKLVNYPESHLATLALFLLISTYKGKQLVNLPLIRLLAEPKSPKKKKRPAADTQTSETE